MGKKQTFIAKIKDAGGGGAFVEIPFDVEKTFGSKRPKVKATIDGVPYRGLLTRMGSECHMLLVLKSIREQIGKTFGGVVKVSVELDMKPREVEVPRDLLKELIKDKEVQTFFEKLSFTHKREYVNWIQDAKKDETRQSRIQKTIAMLKKGKKER